MGAVAATDPSKKSAPVHSSSYSRALPSGPSPPRRDATNCAASSSIPSASTVGQQLWMNLREILVKCTPWDNERSRDFAVNFDQINVSDLLSTVKRGV